MPRTLTAVFDGKVLRPEGSIDLKPNVRYLVTVEQEVPAAEGPSAWDLIVGQSSPGMVYYLCNS